MARGDLERRRVFAERSLEWRETTVDRDSYILINVPSNDHSRNSTLGLAFDEKKRAEKRSDRAEAPMPPISSHSRGELRAGRTRPR